MRGHPLKDPLSRQIDPRKGNNIFYPCMDISSDALFAVVITPFYRTRYFKVFGNVFTAPVTHQDQGEGRKIMAEERRP